MRSSHTTRKLLGLLRQALLLGCAGISALASGADLQALDDSSLSDVQGRDGVSFAVNLNTKVGSSSYTVDNDLGQPTSLIFGNGTATGFHAVKLDISSGGAGAPDFLTWSYPEITSSKPLQLAYDLAVSADGLTLGTGVVMQDVLLGGTSTQLSTQSQGGIAFGMAQQLSISNILLRPNGRTSSTGQMAFSGLQLGAESGAGPWVLADLVNQPGRIDILSDPAGDRIQVGIDFPKTSDPLTGKLAINNISFTTPTGPVDLGSSSIGSMQIQHLNIKFRSP